MDPCAGDGSALFALIVDWFGADWERGRCRAGLDRGLVHVKPSFVEMEQTGSRPCARERKEVGTDPRQTLSTVMP